MVNLKENEKIKENVMNFYHGENYNAYDYFGAHITDTGYIFRVWAPNADSVGLVGSFNNWSAEIPLNKNEFGIWEIVIDKNCQLMEGYGKDLYKYKITGKNGTKLKADPCAFFNETKCHTASILYNINNFNWHDENWMKYRKIMLPNTDGIYEVSAPVNVYEIHLGSFIRHEDSTYLTYEELANKIIPYIKKMGYTHIELMPIMEHPFDGSWGYQICGYYSPTSRFGTPGDFQKFVDRLHQNGIGVILDWVPAHFPKDGHGLYEFDGSPLYEYQGFDRMEHAAWGTRCFDVGRPEVQSFLISNALFWLRKYHVDGLRIDAVASMLYLDYDRKPGEWFPNIYGNNQNLEAISFFKKLNTAVLREFPEVMMIAEESTAWPNVSKSVAKGGLGFNYKWNMGWMNDILSYCREEFVHRKYHHDKLTFSFFYAFSENFFLPISHDEVVHGKKSLIDKMCGTYEEKFAGVRALYCYMMTHPGKKLSFMGNEFCQFKEWNEEESLEWFMCDFEMHGKMQKFCAALNNFYLKYKELWEIDFSWDGFSWIAPDDNNNSVLSYERISKSGSKLIVIINFSNTYYENYRIGVNKGKYELLFSSDDEKYGGFGKKVKKTVTSADFPMHGRKNSVSLSIPPLCGLIYRQKKLKVSMEDYKECKKTKNA